MLQDFEFCLSTHFIFGKDAEKRVGEMLAKAGATTVLLHHGSGKYLYDSGLLEHTIKCLEDAGLRVVELGGVKPNPVISLVREGIALCRKEKVDYVLSVGGGSSIDSGKAIALGVAYDGDAWDLFTTRVNINPKNKLPQAVILTYPASGSESGFGCMLSNDELKVKVGCKSGGNFMRPNYAFMNPELTYSLSPFLTACGVADMYSHIIERYFSPTNFGMIDYMSEGAMRCMIEYGKRVLENPYNYESRAEIMWAGSVAHNETLGVGRRKDMGTHDIGHEISAMYDTVHGVTISVLMPSWMRYVYKTDVNRFVRYAIEVFKVENDHENPEKVALEGIARTEEFFKLMGLPTSFSEAKIPTDQLEELAKRASLQKGGAPLGFFKPLFEADILAIFKAAAK